MKRSTVVMLTARQQLLQASLHVYAGVVGTEVAGHLPVLVRAYSCFCTAASAAAAAGARQRR